jgi:hypothetical protein
MSDRAADFTGSIPIFYDHGLGPIFFAEFADDMARRAAAAPTRVLVQRFQNINRLRLIFIPDEIWYEDDGDLDRGNPW